MSNITITRKTDNSAEVTAGVGALMPPEVQAVCLNCGTAIDSGEVFCERCRSKRRRAAQTRVFTEDDELFFTFEPEAKLGERVKRHIAAYRIPFALSAAAVLVILALVAAQTLSPYIAYTRANMLYDSGRYYEAATAFHSVGQYRDAAERVAMAAMRLSESGEFRDAYELLSMAVDGDEARADVVRRWVDSLVLESRFHEAFEVASEYSPERRTEIARLAAASFAGAGNYREAYYLLADFADAVGTDEIESIADAWLTYLERSGDYEGAIALLSELDFSDSDAIRQRVSAKWIEALKLEGDYQAAYELTATLGLADTALRQRAIEAESIAAACAAEFRVLLDEPESFRIRGVWFNVTGDADAEITGLVLQIDGRGVDGAIASNYAIFERGESGYRFVWSISDGFAAQPEGRGTEAERRALQTMLKDAARFNVAAMLTANPAPVENSLVSVAAIQRLAETGKLEKVEIVDGGNRK